MQVSLNEAIDILKGDSENIVRVMEYYGVNLVRGVGKCPFHNDEHPSFGVKNGKYQCFTATCGVNGDLIDFIRYKENMNTIEAIKCAMGILNLGYTIEKTKLDNLIEYIEKNQSEHFADKTFKLDGIHIYKDKDGEPKLARIKYKNKDTSKKKYSQANIVDMGEYYKLDFKSEKLNLIYNMNNVLKSIQENKYIFLVEGEKDADNLKRLGLTSTTCREINSVTDEVLTPLYNSKLIVIGDNDKEGTRHIQNIRKRLLNRVRSFRSMTFNEIYQIGEKADISDFIEAKFNEGLHTKDIRKIILDKINNTLDEKDEYELQQDCNGIYSIYKKYDKEGELVEEKKIYISNFSVMSLNRIENIDKEEEVVELTIKSNLGEVKTFRERTNKLFLDPKAFNGQMNMAFSFDGKPKDFIRFKNWVNRYFLLEKRNEYLITGIRNVDNKTMLMTNEGGVLANGEIDLNYRADNPITQSDYNGVSRLSKEDAIELSKHIFKFNTDKNAINIIGSLASNMFNSIYRESKGVNLHVTSYVGESGSGKSFTIDNITKPLLGLDNDAMVFSAITPHGLLKAMNDTYMPIVIDEVKPSQAGEQKRQILSNTIRSVTGDVGVIKGNKNQGINRYKYNSSLIIAGEEVLDETALKNRCNIIWFSCNDMTDESLKHGRYFLTKEGEKTLKSLGLEIYLYIMNNFNPDKLVKTLELIQDNFKDEGTIHQRIQATFNNTMLGYITVKHILTSLGADKSRFKSDLEASRLIYQNLKENVLDGEYATKQIYDEVLEAIDELASGTNQYAIAEDVHFKQDSLYLKLDFKTIFPILESYYRNRGKILKVDCKTFIKMITKTKYVEGESKDYYKSVRLGEKVRKIYFIKKEAIQHLDMPTLIPTEEIEWEQI